MPTSDDHAQDLAHDEGLDDLTRFDPEMAQLLATEERRQLESVNLIASENYASPLALRLEGSIFANKNAEGYPGRRVVAGCDGSFGSGSKYGCSRAFGGSWSVGC